MAAGKRAKERFFFLHSQVAAVTMVLENAA